MNSNWFKSMINGTKVGYEKNLFLKGEPLENQTRFIKKLGQSNQV